MLDLNHADDEYVWCYSDEYHCFLQPENSLLLATYYSLIYTEIHWFFARQSYIKVVISVSEIIPL